MHHGTCVTHVPWCMSGSLTWGFHWSRWRGKRSRHSRRMRNPQFYVSGKRPMQRLPILLMVRTVQCFVVFWYELIHSCPCVTAIQGSHEFNKNWQKYIISLIVIDTIGIICFCFFKSNPSRYQLGQQFHSPPWFAVSRASRSYRLRSSRQINSCDLL